MTGLAQRGVVLPQVGAGDHVEDAEGPLGGVGVVGAAGADLAVDVDDAIELLGDVGAGGVVGVPLLD